MKLSLVRLNFYGVQGKFDENIICFNESSSNAESLFRLSLNAQGESPVIFPDIHAIKALVIKAS